MARQRFRPPVDVWAVKSLSLVLVDVKLLDCSNNQLTELPAGLSEMLALEQLYLRHNKLHRLPHLCAPTLQVTVATGPLLHVDLGATQASHHFRGVIVV